MNFEVCCYKNRPFCSRIPDEERIFLTSWRLALDLFRALIGCVVVESAPGFSLSDLQLVYIPQDMHNEISSLT